MVYKRTMNSSISWSDTTKTIDDVATMSIRLTLFRNGSIHFRKAKVELGNVATDWSPAPEDVEDGISKAQNAAETAQSEAGAAKQTADSAIDQVKNATDSIEGLNKSQTSLNEKVDNNKNTSVRDVYIEYCQKPYSWKQIASGSTYSEGTIYYSYDTVKKSYSKVRPKVEAGKLQESVYVKDALAVATDADTWVRSRPQWQDGMVTFQRTIVELYDGTKLPTTIYQMEDYQTIDDLRYLDASNVLSEMRGKNYIFYNEDGLFVYNGQTKEQSTNAIVINKEGICFQRRASLTAAWPTPTSVWTIDGTFNAQDILVKNLNAESIVDGVLTLGNSSKDGELLVKDDANTTLIELSSQRAIWSLIGEQYIIIGKDCGFQLVDNKGKQKYGSSLVWEQVNTGNYKNNVNYYTSQNLLSLIPEVTKNEKGEVTSVLAGTPIPSSGVYTVSYQEVFEVAEQKITGSTNYGGYVQTVNINTTDENNKKHRGLAFVPKW